MNVLIVKFGALGDVVRTSYFAEKIKERFPKHCVLYWLTSENSIQLLEGNPFIDVLETDFSHLIDVDFDYIYSLEDEFEIAAAVSNLNAKNLIGAFYDEDTKKVLYTNSTSEWFDMGLVSKFGKVKADWLKKENLRSHGEIFSDIFEVEKPSPNFYYPDRYARIFKRNITGNIVRIGLNPYAGARWPSKQLSENEIKKLIDYLIKHFEKINVNIEIILIGQGGDRDKNLKHVEFYKKYNKVEAPNTDSSLLALADLIGSLNFLITSDSLALHLAISQGINYLAFFTSTSAVEIDSFNGDLKLRSLAEDYCSYKPNADNSSITAERIMDELMKFKFI